MKITSIWQNFNATAKLLLTIGAIALALSLWHSFTSESAIDRWKDGYNSWKDSAEVRKTQADSLQLLADNALVIADSAAARADSVTIEIQHRDERITELELETEIIAVSNDSTFDALTDGRPENEVVADNLPVVAPWIHLTFSLREENSALNQRIKLLGSQVIDFKRRDVDRLTTIMSLRTAVKLQTARADSLDVIVIGIPPAPPTEKFLGIIPLPSRKTSLIIGTVLGVVVIKTIEQILAGGN